MERRKSDHSRASLPAEAKGMGLEMLAFSDARVDRYTTFVERYTKERLSFQPHLQPMPALRFCLTVSVEFSGVSAV